MNDQLQPIDDASPDTSRESGPDMPETATRDLPWELPLAERMAYWERAWQGMVRHVMEKLREEDERNAATDS